MKIDIQLTVVISYYKALENLKLILHALQEQSDLRFDVILSEDDYNEVTKQFVAEHGDKYTFPLQHIYQKEDNGFRKNEMLNRAIQIAQAERMAFIDGDCIPHRHFVKEYIRNIIIGEPNYYSGRAVLLHQAISDRVVASQSLVPLQSFYQVSRNADKSKDGIYFPFFSLSLSAKGLVGRNWGICKRLLLDINGFDEDYIYAGVGEDADVEWRLLSAGNQLKSMKNKSIVYHIHHPRGYSDEKVNYNYALMARKQSEARFVCLNGIEKFA